MRAAVITLLVSLIAAANSLPGHASTLASRFDAIDALIEAEMRDLGIAGLAVGIVHGNEVVHLRGFGVADPSGRPVTPQTPFVLGSVGKSITALAVMQLVEDGKLDLDAPLSRYLPWLVLGTGSAAEPLTPRHLLYHTSGLKAEAGFLEDDAQTTSENALERRARRLAGAASGPLGRFTYSDANYDILGLLVQTIAAQPFETYVAQHIFTPLGMRHSYATEAPAEKAGLAAGYYRWFGLASYPATAAYSRGSVPSAFLISSAEDMTRLLSAHLNGGELDGQRVLSPSGIATLHQSGVAVSDVAGYAMGWHVEPAWGAAALAGPAYRVPVLLSHAGSTPTFHANVVLMPEQDFGIVILMNTNDYLVGSRFDRLAFSLPLMLLDRAPTPPVAYEDILTQYARALMAAAAFVLAIIALLSLRAPSRRPRARMFAVMGVALVTAGGFLYLIWTRSEGQLLPALRAFPDLAVLVIAVVALPFGAIVLARIPHRCRRARSALRGAVPPSDRFG